LVKSSFNILHVLFLYLDIDGEKNKTLDQ